MADAQSDLTSLHLDYFDKITDLYGAPAPDWQRVPEVGFYKGGPIVDVGRRPLAQIFLPMDSANPDLIEKAKFELSHEALHMLAPRDWPANFLEEGLAVKCSVDLPVYAPWCAEWVQSFISEDGLYQRAYRLVEGVLASSPPGAVAQMRAVEPCFGHLTTETVQLYLGVDLRTATDLLRGCVEGA